MLAASTEPEPSPAPRPPASQTEPKEAYALSEHGDDPWAR
jgi:hypothetical protein